MVGNRRFKTKKIKKIGADRNCRFSVSDRGYSKLYQQRADSVFGRLIKDEKKLKTEVVKALSDECEGSKNEDLEFDDLDSAAECCYFDADESIDYYKRLHRTWDVEPFLEKYKFGLGEKICIPPRGQPLSCFSYDCFDSTWVGVHGMQSICVVIRRDMDMTRLTPFYQKDSLKYHNMRMFARAAISEVECLPHKDVDFYDANFRRLCTGNVKNPFAVVSLGLDESTSKKKKKKKRICGYEDSKHDDSCVDKTISFLESVVSSDLLRTHYGIIRVAIKAYQLIMCRKELRADDIWVTIMNDKYGQFDYLPMDIIGEQLDFVNSLSSEKDPRKIGKQLVLVNGISSEKDTQKPLFEYRGDLVNLVRVI